MPVLEAEHSSQIPPEDRGRGSVLQPLGHHGLPQGSLPPPFLCLFHPSQEIQLQCQKENSIFSSSLSRPFLGKRAFLVPFIYFKNQLILAIMQFSVCRGAQHFRQNNSAVQAKLGDLDTEPLLMPAFFVDCAPWGAELFPWVLSLATAHCPTLADTSGHFFPLTARWCHSSPEQHGVRKSIPFCPQTAGKGREKGQGGAQGPAQPTRGTFMTGWAKYLALQSQNPVCTAAEMKLLCPTASSASSAVCGEGQELPTCRARDTPGTPPGTSHCPSQAAETPKPLPRTGNSAHPALGSGATVTPWEGASSLSCRDQGWSSPVAPQGAPGWSFVPASQGCGVGSSEDGSGCRHSPCRG